MLLIFDVDGTLTPSRGLIDPLFKRWLMQDLKIPFVLVTGSDPIKTREQVGNDLYDSTDVYNCSGNHVFHRGVEVYKSTWGIPTDLERFLESTLSSSKWHTKTGRHVEHRVGLCNFSVVGRNATVEQRKSYHAFDSSISNERTSIAAEIMSRWPNIEASVAGETGIDIYERGCGKDQILGRLLHLNPLHFFGDRMDEAGNDHGLARAIEDGGHGKAYHVKDWQDTRDIIYGLNEHA
jgi:phosphomannomutase